jgi:hypothetical protein
MSFAEFQIRLFAWSRLEERAWEKVRILAWYAMTGSHQDPKKMPKTLSQFMKLGLDDKVATKVTEEQKIRFLEATKEYLKQIK